MADNPRLGEADDYNAQVGMTLADIAYAEPGNLVCQLAYPHYATKGQWRLRWLGVSAGNQMYVAQNAFSRQFAVAIRGSTTDPWSESFWIDWFDQDLCVVEMAPPPFPAGPGALIAQGALDGLDDLLAMRDGPSGQTLVQFIQANVTLGHQSLVVLGHSLGGNLASVLAPYLYEAVCKPQQKPPSCIVPLTFAAPTSGNVAFVSYLASTFGPTFLRYWNDLDVAPHGWSLAGLDWVMSSYSPAPVIPDYLYGAVWLMQRALMFEGCNYAQPEGIRVTGSLRKHYWWFHEAGYQHSATTYLGLFGAPPVIFPCPPNSPAANRLPREQLQALA